MKIKVRKIKEFFKILAKIIAAILLALFFIYLIKGIIRISTIICVTVVCAATIVLAWYLAKKR